MRAATDNEVVNKFQCKRVFVRPRGVDQGSGTSSVSDVSSGGDSLVSGTEASSGGDNPQLHIGTDSPAALTPPPGSTTPAASSGQQRLRPFRLM